MIPGARLSACDKKNLQGLSENNVIKHNFRCGDHLFYQDYTRVITNKLKTLLSVPSGSKGLYFKLLNKITN